MSQQAFFFDGTRCSGCKTCMFACKDAYDLDVGTAYRRVLEYTGGDTVRNGDGTFGFKPAPESPDEPSGNGGSAPAATPAPAPVLDSTPKTGAVSLSLLPLAGFGFAALGTVSRKRR